MAKDNLHSALNAHQANKMRSAWIESLSKACGQPIDDSAFLPLDETEKLKKNFFGIVKGKRGTISQWWGAEEQGRLSGYFDDLLGIIGDRHVILFSGKDKYFGAVCLPASCILRNPMQIWRVVEEDLAFAFDDLSSGICLELNFYDAEGKHVSEGVYELTAWGVFAARK